MGVATQALHPPAPTWLISWRAVRAVFRWPMTPRAIFERVAPEIQDFGAVHVLGFHFYAINHPDLVQECLVTRHRDFHKDHYYEFLRAILGNGLLTSEDEFHLRQRKMIQPAFHSARIRGYGEAMVRYSEECGARWQDGQQVDMQREMMALALAIVGKCLFNSEVSGEAETVQHALDAILPMDKVFMAPGGRWLMKLPLPFARRFHHAMGELDRILYGMIAEHRAKGDQGDLLTMLLEAKDEDDQSTMSDKQIRDESITLFLAGHETTAVALTWTFYCLSQHPEAEAKLHEEVDRVLGDRVATPEDYPQLRYTRSVFAEVMRLHPPAPGVGRVAVRDTQLGDTPVRKGSMVMLGSYVMHRNPRFWPDPGRFDPDRFNEANSAGRHKYAYFPFGGGRRLCVGEGFAWMEGVLVLASLARTWRATLKPGHKADYQPRVTLRPKNGMPMTLHRRKKEA